MLLSFLLIQETLGHRFVHSTVLGSGIPNEPLELAKVATDPPPPEESHSCLLHREEGACEKPGL